MGEEVEIQQKAPRRTLLHVPQEQYTLHSNSNRSVGTIHGSLALVRLLPCFAPLHFFFFHNHLIYSGLQTCYRTQYVLTSDESRRQHGHTLSDFRWGWSFSIRLAPPSSHTACNTHSFLLFPGIGCRLFFVLCPSLYLGPCFYSAGCYPAFSYVFSPASDAGVLPPLWRGRVFPFTVQSRDHLATITDIYVPSFLRPIRGSLAPRLLFVHCAV